MAEGDSAALFQNTSSEQSIYRIPSLLRDLDPNAYEPRVVSIGPYHHGKAQLQAMEKHKKRALDESKKTISIRIVNRNVSIRFDDILAEFKREPRFLEEVRKCYKEPLEPQWSDDDVFSRLMVLDGCFLLELLFKAHPENPALLSHVKMDMLVLDNQIPLFVLGTLAGIIVKLAPGWQFHTEPIQFGNFPATINRRIWKFYGNMNHEIPADLPDYAHHVLDAYMKGCIGIGDYDGWESRRSARELYFYGVEFRASSGGGLTDGFVGRGSFTDVAFKASDFFNICKSQNGQVQQIHQNGQAQQIHQNGQALR